MVIVPFFVKVVQTAVAHACDLAVHLVTAQSRRAKTDPAPYSAQNSTLLHAASTDRRQNRFSRTVLGVKLDLAPRCIHRSQTEPFLELEKNMLCDMF